AIYDTAAPELSARGPWFPGFAGPAGDERPADDELAGNFGPVTERHYRFSLSYTTEDYLDLLRSLAEHEHLAPSRRDTLFDCLREGIDATGDTVQMDYETRLYITRAT